MKYCERQSSESCANCAPCLLLRPSSWCSDSNRFSWRKERSMAMWHESCTQVLLLCDGWRNLHRNPGQASPEHFNTRRCRMSGQEAGRKAEARPKEGVLLRAISLKLPHATPFPRILELAALEMTLQRAALKMCGEDSDGFGRSSILANGSMQARLVTGPIPFGHHSLRTSRCLHVHKFVRALDMRC